MDYQEAIEQAIIAAKRTNSTYITTPELITAHAETARAWAYIAWVLDQQERD